MRRRCRLILEEESEDDFSFQDFFIPVHACPQGVVVRDTRHNEMVKSNGAAPIPPRQPVAIKKNIQNKKGDHSPGTRKLMPTAK
ncbi:unnamed protein product [Linum trigynum]|uniref:Uncharacterized protein n=1 Tax=Linum trigynum TaxID=586398 RepID=A0AAV2DD20_9ROSI